VQSQVKEKLKGEIPRYFSPVMDLNNPERFLTVICRRKNNYLLFAKARNMGHILYEYLYQGCS